MYNVSPAQNNNNNNKNKDEERGVEAFDNMRHYPSIHLLVIKFTHRTGHPSITGLTKPGKN